MADKSRANSIDLIGVDGCKAGWFAVMKHAETGAITSRVFSRFIALLQWAPAPGIIAVDMPIGLSSVSQRASDVAARKLLDKRRKSSVFATPVRQTLDAPDYAAACAENRKVTSKSISQQAFNLLPKIKELDDCLSRSSTDAARVFEVHPELSLMQLQLERGGPPGGIVEPKRTGAGHDIRKALLESVFDDDVEKALHIRISKEASRDDVLDAFAALWSAQRIADQTAASVLAIDEADAQGLKMNIRY